MRLLALDAALGPCSVALIEDGCCLGVRHGADSRSATASLPGMVQALLAAHGGGFDAVAVTVGPGGFTGLRGALALANGLALGAGVPVVGVTVAEAFLERDCFSMTYRKPSSSGKGLGEGSSCCDNIRRVGPHPGPLLEGEGDVAPATSTEWALAKATWVALDSRRAGRVFLCHDGVIEAVALALLPIPTHPVTVCGDAADLVVEALRQAGVDASSDGHGAVSAEAVGRVGLRRLAGELALCPAQPLYVEPPEARAPVTLRPAPA